MQSRNLETNQKLYLGTENKFIKYKKSQHTTSEVMSNGSIFCIRFIESRERGILDK